MEDQTNSNDDLDDDDERTVYEGAKAIVDAALKGATDE